MALRSIRIAEFRVRLPVSPKVMSMFFASGFPPTGDHPQGDDSPQVHQQSDN